MSELQFNAVPIWWSTGVYDPLFPPSLLKSYTEDFSTVRFCRIAVDTNDFVSWQTQRALRPCNAIVEHAHQQSDDSCCAVFTSFHMLVT